MKLAKRILITILAAPISILLVWYIFGFLPYISDLKSISESGKMEIASVEKRAYEIALCSETAVGLRIQVTKYAYRSLSLKDNHQKTLYRNLNTAFWYFASYINFNDKEIFYIWSKTVWLGNGTGLVKAANNYFNKPLSQLSDIELASLVAMAKAPSLYKLGSDRLKTRVGHILEQVSHNHIN